MWSVVYYCMMLYVIVKCLKLYFSTVLLLTISWQWRKHAGEDYKCVHALLVCVGVCEQVRAISLGVCKSELRFAKKHATSLPGDCEPEYKTGEISKCLMRDFCFRENFLIWFVICCDSQSGQGLDTLLFSCIIQADLRAFGRIGVWMGLVVTCRILINLGGLVYILLLLLLLLLLCVVFMMFGWWSGVWILV